MNIKILSILLSSALILAGSALEAKVITVTRYSSSVEKYQQLYNSNTPMITLYACSPGFCKVSKEMQDLFYRTAKANSDITFALVRTWTEDASYHLTKGINQLPLLKFSYNGTLVKQNLGRMTEEQLNQHIAELRTLMA